jgi:hypothetical protein
MFGRKQCFGCKQKFKLDKLYQIKVKAADGKLLIHFCEDCAKMYLQSESDLDDKSL